MCGVRSSDTAELLYCCLLFKQKTAYEMRISDWSADVCSSDLTSDHRPLLAGVDVLGKAARPVIVAFGDSITDNTGCAIDAVPICRWGDVLGRRQIGSASCRERVCLYV